VALEVGGQDYACVPEVVAPEGVVANETEDEGFVGGRDEGVGCVCCGGGRGSEVGGFVGEEGERIRVAVAVGGRVEHCEAVLRD